MSDNSQEEKEFKVREEGIMESAVVLFSVSCLVYLLPVLICLIINFCEFVAFGNRPLSEFDWGFYSFGQVNGWYAGIFEWGKEFMYRLKH